MGSLDILGGIGCPYISETRVIRQIAEADKLEMSDAKNSGDDVGFPIIADRMFQEMRRSSFLPEECGAVLNCVDIISMNRNA